MPLVRRTIFYEPVFSESFKNFTVFFQSFALSGIRVTLEMVRVHLDSMPLQFRISPVKLNGIGDLEGGSKLQPNQTVMASWTMKSSTSTRLTQLAHYQVTRLCYLHQDSFYVFAVSKPHFG